MLQRIFVIFFFVSAIAASALAERLLLKDYATVALPPRRGLDLFLEYLTMNSTMDVAGVRDAELGSMDSRYRTDALGDAVGWRVQANYGVSEKTALHGEVEWKKIDSFLGELKTLTAELSVRREVARRGKTAVALDVGVRGNRGEDVTVTEPQALSALTERITGGSYAVRDEGDLLWFDRRISGGTVSLGVSKEGRPAPAVAVKDMWDVSPFVRAASGVRLGRWLPSLFVEGGTTFLNSRVESTLGEYVASEEVIAFPADLSRREDYGKGGASLLFSLPGRIQGQIEYAYLRLFRGAGTGDNEENHIIRADMAYFMSKRVAFGVGGVYYHRQLNGILPFLYNQYTRTSFDHPYGIVNAGLIVSFL